MTVVTFDTLKFAKRLESAGIPAAHAEAMAEAFQEATGEELVTQSYLDTRIAQVEAKIAESASSMVKWMAGLLIAQAGLVAALVKLL